MSKTERIIASLVVAASASLALFWSMTPEHRGKAEAQHDLLWGHYEIKVAGKRASYSTKYEDLLQKRYSIQTNVVAGCVVDADLSEYMTAYNAVARKGIIKHFGKDVFAECERAALAGR